MPLPPIEGVAERLGLVGEGHPPTKKPGLQGDLKKGAGHREGDTGSTHCTLPQPINNVLLKGTERASHSEGQPGIS